MSNGRGIGTIIDASGSPVTNDMEKANLFNNYFGSVCTTDNGDIPAVNKIVPDNVALDDIDFNRNAVLRALKKIKPNESSGPDNLPPVFFRKLSNVLAEPLSILFSSFMSIGKLPEDWKNATVLPVYKSGLSSQVENYRPISLTCVACKVMERVIASSMLQYLRDNHIITRR